MRRLMPLFALLVAAAGCKSSSSGDMGAPPDLAGSQACTAIGCGPTFALTSATLPLTAQQIQASTLMVCRNQQCESGTFAAWQPPMASGAATSIEFPDPAQRDSTHAPLVDCAVWRDDTGFHFQLFYTTWSSTDGTDGDVYDVTLTGGDGTVILSSHQTVAYVVSHPNGLDCPPECHEFTGTF